MMRRAAFVFAALTVGVLLAAPSAGAQSSSPPGKGADDDYTSACSALLLASTQVKPGAIIGVQGSAANAGPVDIQLDGVTLVTTTAAPFTHTFSTSITIPAGTSAGTHKVQATQGDTGCAAQVASLTVLGLTIETPPAEQPPAAPATAPLARTGSNSTLPLIRFGFGLLAAGGVAIFVSRRRKASVSADA